MALDLTSLSKDKFLEIIGENDPYQKYFSTVYDKMSKNKIVKWNWAAAIFNVHWLFYRRLYKEAILGMIAFFLFSVLVAIIFPYYAYAQDYISEILTILPLFIGFGLFGNYVFLSGLVSRNNFNRKLPKGTTFLKAFLFFVVSSILWGAAGRLLVIIINRI